MKLAKSLLLGSAAGLMAVAGANEADLPVRAAAPAVDYVRVCSAYGNGFFFIPGTDTCLRVGGSVRAEINSASPAFRSSNRDRNYWTTGGRGQVFFDTRTATEMGLLRTFTRLEFAHTLGAGTVPLAVRDSYIQWGGLTVGRTSFSFFQFYGAATMMGRHAQIDAFGQGPNLLAYTATFGGGFEASVSLEHNPATRVGWAAVAGGNRIPDVVGRVRYSGGWGSLHVAGVVKEIRTNQAAANNGVTANKYGWALTAQANVKLPMLSPGSEMWLAGTYGEGAVGYETNGPSQTYRHFTTLAAADGYVVGTGVSLTKAWSLATGLRYNFTPQWQANVHAAYGKMDVPTGSGARDFDWWNVGANIAWRPVSGLAILGEVDYKAAKRQRILATDRRNSDAWATRLRIQRDF